MNEVPKHFRPVENITVSEDINHEIVYTISKLKTIANNHEDFEVLEKFMDAIADFRGELLKTFQEGYINQVPLYHHLIGSGVAIGTNFDTPITEETKLAIEKEIVEFTKNVLSPMVTGELV